MGVHGFLVFVLLHAANVCYLVNGDNLTDDVFQNTSYYYYESSESLSSLIHWRYTKLIPSVHTVVFLVAFPLNLMAIVIFLVKMKDRKPAVVYMLNLATSDILLISVLPFLIIYRFSGNNWVIGEGMCRFVIATFYCNMYCSILLMTSISVDRFLAVVHPVRSISWRTLKHAWLVCGVIWVISLVSTVPLLLGKQTFFFHDLNITTCYDMQYSDDLRGFYFYYFILLLSLFFFIPLIITIFCYISLIRRLSTIKMSCPHKRSRAIYLTVIVLCVFVLCFGPTNVIHFCYYLQMYKYEDDSLYHTYMISCSISSINCCLDPLIYYFASSQCQRYVYSLLDCRKNYHLPSRQHLVLEGKEEYTEVISSREEAC